MNPRIVLLLGLLLTCFIHLKAEITNVTVAQRTDGSKIVDIGYDLSTDGAAVKISLRVSLDAGASYPLIPEPENLTGDVGDGVPPGTGKSIQWHAGSETIPVVGDSIRVRLSAGRIIEHGILYAKQVGGIFQIFRTDLDFNESTQLTFDTIHSYHPIWSPDGQRIAYGDANGIQVIDNEGTLLYTAFVPEPGMAIEPTCWHNDNFRIIYHYGSASTSHLIGIVGMDGSGNQTLINNEGDTDCYGQISWVDDNLVGYLCGSPGGDMHIRKVCVRYLDTGTDVVLFPNNQQTDKNLIMHPDGQHMIWSEAAEGNSNHSLKQIEIATGIVTALIAPDPDNTFPVYARYTPDGTTIYYTYQQEGQYITGRCNADGTSQEVLHTDSDWMYVSWVK